MLDDSLAYFKRKVQSREVGIALLKLLHRAQCMEVVVEALSVSLHGGVQGPFPGVSERRMADIMGQRQGLNQVFIQVQLCCNGP